MYQGTPKILVSGGRYLITGRTGEAEINLQGGKYEMDQGTPLILV
jgi:hypothetical protein